MVYQLVSLTTLFLRFNRLVIVEAGIGNLRVSQDDFFSHILYHKFATTLLINFGTHVSVEIIA